MRDLRLQIGYENFVRMTVSDFALLLNLVGPQIVVASSVSTLVRMPQELAAGCFHCPRRMLCVLIVGAILSPALAPRHVADNFHFNKCLAHAASHAARHVARQICGNRNEALHRFFLLVNYSAGKEQLMLLPDYICYQ